jgi:NAD(P)-dependent dehydrogenase (short-subunit alcohol dehydrogenase family)
VARTVVVTGSASGIGRATVAALGRQGSNAIGVDRQDADVVADLGTPEGRRHAAEAIADHAHGRLDGLVACAGVSSFQVDQPTIVRVNYFGVVDLAQALRPLLACAARPAVAVVASVALLWETDAALTDACLSGDEERACAIAAEGRRTAYASTKRAVARWVRRTAPTEGWAGAGICLNAVAPGLVRTPMTAIELDDPTLRDDLLARIRQPMAAVGQPEHVAETLTWLAGPHNRFVTGQVLYVDGGFEAKAAGDEVGRL